MARRQLEIAGTERKTVKEIDAAAEHYVEQRDKRMALSRKEKEAKDLLIGAMKKHNLTVYRDDNTAPPMTVLLTEGKDQVKVSESDADEETEEEVA